MLAAWVDFLLVGWIHWFNQPHWFVNWIVQNPSITSYLDPKIITIHIWRIDNLLGG